MKKEILFGFLISSALLIAIIALSGCEEVAGKATGLGGACTNITNCTLGLMCKNNTCAAKYCTDTDGSNITNKGTVYGLNDQNQPFLDAQDYCQGNSTVIEYICSGTKVISMPYTCPAGKKCTGTNGACL